MRNAAASVVSHEAASPIDCALIMLGHATLASSQRILKFSLESYSMQMTLRPYTGKKRVRRRKQLMLTYLLALGVVFVLLFVFLASWFAIKAMFHSLR